MYVIIFTNKNDVVAGFICRNKYISGCYWGQAKVPTTANTSNSTWQYWRLGVWYLMLLFEVLCSHDQEWNRKENLSGQDTVYTYLGHLGIQLEQGNCLIFATCRTSHIIILSDIAFSEAVSEPFSIARSEPSNKQEDAYDIVQAMQEVQLQAHAAPPRPVDTSGWVKTVVHV